MSAGDPAFSRAFIAAYELMPQWRRDQLDALFRDAVPVIERLCAAVEKWETAGIAAVEDHANGESA